MRAAAFLSQSPHGVYYARFVVPSQRLTPSDSREFRLSTGTKDPRAARVIARHLRVCFERYLLENAKYHRVHAIEYLRAHMPKRNDQPMSFGVKVTRDGYELTDLTPEDAKAFVAGDMDGLIEHLNRVTQVAQPAPIQDVSPNNAPGTRRNAPNAYGNSSPGKEPNSDVSPNAGAGDEWAAGQSPQPHNALRKAPARSRLRIERLYNEYIEYEQGREDRGELGEKKVPQIKTRLAPFMEHFAGRELNSITTFDAEQYARALAFYPTFLDKIPAAKGLKFDAIIAKTKAGELLTRKGEPAKTIAASTHAGYINDAINFLDYCRRRGLADAGVIEGLRIAVPHLRAGTKRRAFVQKEMQAVFSSPYYRDARYNSAYQYWVPLIAAFTGARVNEIAQLQPGDLKQDDAGLWYFDITTTGDDGKSIKNEASKRIVPVHQKLLNLHFIDYVRAKRKEGAANLFDIERQSMDKFGRTPARWFNDEYLRDYLNLQDPGITFHSFRHRFITSMHEAIFNASDIKGELIVSTTPALIMRRMVGHSEASIMTAGRHNDVHTDTYTGAFSIAMMKKVMDLLDYPGVYFHPYVSPTEGKRQRKRGNEISITGEDLGSIL